MKILHYYIYTLFISQLAYSQVGVNTATPKSSLHDAGTLQVTKEIRVGSDNSVKGNAGTYGQVLVSKGEGQSPTWENIQEITVMPVVSAIAQYSGSGVLTTNAETIFKFNTVPYLDNKSITYNNTTGEFTFLKAGYYRIYATSTSNSSGSVTAGQVRTMLDKNGILFLAKSSYQRCFTSK